MIPTRLRLETGGSTVPFLALTILVASIWATASVFAEPSILERERDRRASQATEAQQELARGDKAYNAGDYEEAVAAYAAARGLLGPGAATNALWTASAERYAQASVERARQLAKNGSQQEAHALLDSVLSPELLPGHPGATQLKGQIDDPIRYNPGLTPEHVVNVDKVRRLLYEAQGFTDLGRYGQAQAFYEEVLSIDATNTAARRGMDELNRLKSEHYDSARDHTKALMMEEVASTWEMKPVPVDDLGYVEEFGTVAAQRAADEKLRSIVVPAVELEQVTLSEAVEFLRQMSVAYDQGELDPARRGISFVVDLGTGESEVAKKIQRTRFNLTLQNVPLGKVLQYVNDATGTKSRLDDYAVIIQAEGSTGDEMMTRTFRVPPDLLSREALGQGGGGGDDPFADNAAPQRGLLPKRLAPKEFLQNYGVSFPEGSSASLTRGVLRVTNTRLNLDYVEQVVAGIVEEEPVVVVIEARIINVSQNHLEEIGYDWFTTGGNVGGDIFYGGGSPGNGTSIEDFGVEGSRALTSGLRSGGGTSGEDTMDSLLRTGTSSGSSLLNEGAIRAPGILSLVGVYDDTTVGVMLRGLQQNDGQDENIKKTVVTRSGQKALIESVIEMIVPTEYEPPELPNSVGVTDLGVGGGPIDPPADGGSGLFPVTPATPTAFETVKIGCQLEVEPLVGPNRQIVELAIQPIIKRFEGFINYGSPISSPASTATGDLTSTPITENRIEMPVFSAIRSDANLTIADGQTVVLGGLMEDKSFKYEDKVPILGDLPLLGRFFRSESHTSSKNAMVILVTVKLLDPSGRPYRDR